MMVAAKIIDIHVYTVSIILVVAFRALLFLTWAYVNAIAIGVCKGQDFEIRIGLSNFL